MFSTNLEMLKVVTFSDTITFNSHNNSLPFSPFREGNSNPLQCSCLENPRDGGAWWAAIYGVAQSRTRLKQQQQQQPLLQR